MSDFYFNGKVLEFGRPKDKFENNEAAVKLVKLLERENREATPEEQEILINYTGWGDSRVNEHLWKLRDVLTKEEYQAAESSALNAHYTALPVIREMWFAMEQLGGIDARLNWLDPSAGAGHFRSMAPEASRDVAQWTEIELEPMTAKILRYLHPSSKVQNVAFEKAVLPLNFFDRAMSNIPFGNYGVYHKAEMPKSAKKAIHNFFLCYTWHLLKPGGVMAYITSRFTMDAKDSITRKWMADRFEMLSAVRLPFKAFVENAGAEVVTDVLIVRKRPEIVDSKDVWIHSKECSVKGEYDWSTPGKVFYNAWYQEHPEFVLGKQKMTGSMYRSDGYNVEPTEDVAQMMHEVYSQLKPLEEIKVVSKPVEIRKDLVVVLADEDKRPVAVAMMEIYKTAKRLIQAENTGDKKADALRKELNDLYDKFSFKYGSLAKNAKSLDGGERFFLEALEIDGYKKADIFYKSTTRSAKKTGKLSASDALLLSLDTHGKVDIDFIAKSTKLSRAQALEDLGNAVYFDPVKYEWQTANEYLSGNVREKWINAVAAAAYDPQYQRNVDALAATIPGDVTEKIGVPLGAGWVPAEYVKQFIEHLVGGEWKVRYVEQTATWVVELYRYYMLRRSDMSSKWGTSSMDTEDLIKDGLNSKTPQVYKGSLENRVLDIVETTAAQQKLKEIKDEWEKWLWQDEERKNTLIRLFNDKFRSVVNVGYDGSHLSTPGLNINLSLRSNQRDVAWRIIQRPATLVGHEVGMGKTLSALVSIMEGRRLGIVKKAMLVVPNHLMSNWTNAILTAYPGGNWLLPTKKDLAKGNRARLLSMIATGAWDGILLPQTTFKMISASEQLWRDFYNEQMEELKDALHEAKEGRDDRKVQKEIEKQIKRLQAKIEKLADYYREDTKSVSWEELGIDMLCVDEFHHYKNLMFVTKMNRVAGLANGESQRALDMFIKMRYTVDNGGKIVGMTGTPITNTIAEMFTMLRYFAKDRLKELGLSHFDAWARMFARAEEGLEMTPDGSGFRMNTRFRTFVNVPELMTLFLEFADMRRIDLTNTEIQRPELYKGKPVKVVVNAGPDLEEYVQTLAERAEAIRKGMVEPEEDNMLKVVGDGRKAALDMKLVVPNVADAAMPKLDRLAEIVKQVWEVSNKVKGTQLIFCDLGTPKAKKKISKAEAKKLVEFTPEIGDDIDDEDGLEIEVETEQEKALTTEVYSEIKKRLIANGIPEKDIAFIHDAKSTEKKAQLERDVNSGKIRVLLGSNEKMGTGLNVQERLIAIHQITPPWRPADIEQQVGRMWRQGNLMPQVFQFVHVTEKSFDGYIWQLLENKAGFIAQIMTGAIGDREMEDIGEAVLTFTEIKGLASGNPKIMQQIVLSTEVNRLDNLRVSWKSARWALTKSIDHHKLTIAEDEKKMEMYQRAIAIRNANHKDEFQIELVKEIAFDGEEEWVIEKDRDKAGSRLLMLAEMAAVRVNKSASDRFIVAHYEGHTIYGTSTKLMNEPGETMGKGLLYYKTDDWMTPITSEGPKGVIISLTAIMRNLDDAYEKMKRSVEDARNNITHIEADVQKPWEHQERYDVLYNQLQEINKELQAAKVETIDVTAVLEEKKTAQSVLDSCKEIETAIDDMKAMLAKDSTLVRFATKMDPVQKPVAEIVRESKPATKKAPAVTKVPPPYLPEIDTWFTAIVEAKDEDLVQQDMFGSLFG